MSEITPSSMKMPRLIAAGGILLILMAAILAFPSAARTTIQQIQPGDMIFVYEQNLDISGLGDGVHLVTSLRKYQEDNPTKALLREIPVPDDTSFSLIPEAFGNLLGVYYAFNSTAGAMSSAAVQVPSVSIGAVLANPNHRDSIEGLTIPDDTPIAFKIISVDVGGAYHAGSLYPATVDLVLTTPGGAQLTTIQGMDFSRMNLTGQVFYTDDPGRPGAITLRGLGTGTFSVQAKWRDPASFDNLAPDSNILSFSIGRTTVVQPTSTPVVPPVTTVVTTRTTIPTVAETTSPATPPATVTTLTSTPPVPATTLSPAGTPSPSPTSMPTGAWLAFISPALAFPLLIRSRRER